MIEFQSTVLSDPLLNGRRVPEAATSRIPTITTSAPTFFNSGATTSVAMNVNTPISEPADHRTEVGTEPTEGHRREHQQQQLLDPSAN